jgi:hypothetical protein
MTFNNLLPLLEDLQSILQAAGCKVTQVAVSIYSAEHETTIDVGPVEADAPDDRAIPPVRE